MKRDIFRYSFRTLHPRKEDKNQPIDPVRAHVVCPNKQIALVSRRELCSMIPVPVYTREVLKLRQNRKDMLVVLMLTHNVSSVGGG